MSRRNAGWIERYIHEDRIAKLHPQDNIHRSSEYSMSTVHHDERFGHDRYAGLSENERYQPSKRKGFGRWYSINEGRRKQRNICLALLLLIAVLILAFIIGLIVYFIILDAPPDKPNYDSHTATLSAPLINEEFKPGMGLLSSDEAQGIAKPFCAEMDNYFGGSILSKRYSSCVVQQIRKTDRSPITCACADKMSTSKENRAEILFDLVFDGVITEEEILLVLNAMTSKEVSQGFQMVKIGNFVIDVTTTVEQPTIVTPGSDANLVGGVQAELVATVYNLTWMEALHNNNSLEFNIQSIALCNNLDTIFLQSPLKDRYFSCKIKTFENEPVRVIAELQFVGEEYTSLKMQIAQILISGTKVIRHEEKEYRMIGQLMIDPSAADILDFKNIFIDIGGLNLGPLRPTQPTTGNEQNTIDITVFVYNLTISQTLKDPTSPMFLAHSRAFCHDIKTLFSTVNSEEPACNIQEFLAPDDTSEFARIRFRLQFTKALPLTMQEFRVLIEKYTPEVVHGRKETADILRTHKIGYVFVVLDRIAFSNTTISMIKSTTLPEPTSITLTSASTVQDVSFFTTEKTSLHGDVTSFVLHTSSSNGKTETSSVTPSTVSIDWDTVSISTSSLSQESSLYSSSGDVSKLSTYATSTSFADKNEFSTVQSSSIVDEMSSSYSSFPTNVATTTGSMTDLPVTTSTSVNTASTSIQATPTPVLTVTRSVGVTSTQYVVYDATYIQITYGLYRFNYAKSFDDRQSQEFSREETLFCGDVNNIIGQSYIGPFLRTCEIISFRKQPNRVEFGLMVSRAMGEYITSNITDAFSSIAPQKDEEGYRVALVGDLRLILTQYEFQMRVTNATYSHTMTSHPSITPSTSSSYATSSSVAISSSVLPPTCPPDMFTCTDGLCIDPRLKCDGFPDCFDNSDEIESLCGKSSITCPEGLYRCKNGVCVNGLQCDGRVDCADGSDEHADVCGFTCSENPCENGGECMELQGSYKCQCKEGWRGQNCTKVDFCYRKPCANDGTCVSTFESYFCADCAAGWRGQNCTQVDFCSRDPCEGRGMCVQTDESYSCQCYLNWMGPDCSQVDECFYNPCQNKGTCQLVLGMPKCKCTPGWRGTNCTQIDYCSENPCKNNGDCVLTSNRFVCSCKPGWIGGKCELVDACFVNPCRNNGQCTRVQGSYKCLCSPEWTGQNCTEANETIIDYSYLARNLTWMAALTESSSEEFQLLANAFCSDVDAILKKYPEFAGFTRGCKVISFGNNPPTINWQLVYPGYRDTAFKISINETLFSDLTRVILGDSEGVVIGGIFIRYKNADITTLTLEFRILNFTWTGGLSDRRSSTFQNLSSSVCKDINGLMVDNKSELPPYITCRVSEYRKSPLRMLVSLTFGGILQINEIEEPLSKILQTSVPLIRFKNNLVYNLGEFLVFAENYTNLTLVPLSLRVLNMTWTDELENENAPITAEYAKDITNDIDRILLTASSNLINFDSSRVISFTNNPMRANLQLQFDGKHDIGQYRRRVVNLIQKEAPSVFYRGNTVYLLGGFLVYHGVYIPTKHDSWRSNITFFMPEFVFYPQYKNQRSQLFLDFQETFCDEIGNYIRSSPLANRFYRCFFEKIGETPIHTLTFSIIFNGTETIVGSDVINSITSQAIKFPGNVWFIAGELVYPGMFQNIAVNISDYRIIDLPSTTIGPGGFTIVNASFVTLNNTQALGLNDPRSSAFQSITGPFCNELSQIYRNVTITKKLYDKCEVESFSVERNTQKINFYLRFKGQLESSVRNELFEILLEKAARTDVNGAITTIRIGTLLIYEESLNNYVTRIVMSTTTAAPVLCDGTKEYAADPTNCRNFIICEGEMVLQCPEAFSFSEIQNSCVPDINCT